MRHRFIEAEDMRRENHGKFSLMQYEAGEFAYRSRIAGTPLLESLPVAKRLGPFPRNAVFLLDLQTQEGMVFDPLEDPAMCRRRFLVHPLFVCILYFPVMQFLHGPMARIWELPHKIVLDPDEVRAQPGVLVDAAGNPVRRAEWSRRGPLIARLRNREVAEGSDPEVGQDLVTEDEQNQALGGVRPTW